MLKVDIPPRLFSRFDPILNNISHSALTIPCRQDADVVVSVSFFAVKLSRRERFVLSARDSHGAAQMA